MSGRTRSPELKPPQTSGQQGEPQRRARKWRFLSMGGGLLLAGSFFMPAIESCNKPVVPVERAAEMLDVKSIADLPEAVLTFCCYVAPYLLGLLVTVGAAMRLLQAEAARKVSATIFIVLLSIVAGSLVCYSAAAIGMVAYQGDSGLLSDLSTGWPIWLVILGYPGIALAYVWRTRRLRGRRWICHLFIASVWGLFWFAFWYVAVSGEILYGLYYSLVGSIAVLLATIGEAAVFARQRYLRTGLQLLIGRLGSFDQHVGHCPACRYQLFGLREQRCPECGRPFTFDEIGVSPGDLGFLGGRIGVTYDPGR